MQQNIKEINLGVGLGELKFGMTRDEVVSLIGKPEDIDMIDGEGDNDMESWHYDTKEFSLLFDEDYGWRLVSISVSDPFFTLFGKSIIGMSKSDLLQFLEYNEMEISDEEDISEEDENLQLIEIDEAGILIWLNEDEIIELQFLPDVEEDGETLIWPQ